MAPILNPKVTIKVPIHFPKINPPIMATGDPNPKKGKTHNTARAKKQIEIKNISLFQNNFQLDEYSNRVADYFLSLRLLQKGDTVALYMSNRVEFIGIWLGLAKIGLVPALINSHQRQNSLEHAIIASNSKVFI